MPPEPFDPRASSAVVGAFLRGLPGGGEAAFAARIHPADEMYRYGRDLLRGSDEAAAVLYYLKGSQIARAASDVALWRFGRLDAVGSLLDFACGFGRATRFLARAWPAERMFVADVEPAAARFLEAELGVRGVGCGSDPDSFRPGRRFELVLAASFFSHLPPGPFEAWLGRLYSVLAPGGVLAFSTHGPELARREDVDWSAGIAFRPTSETSRLDGRDYGTSYVTPRFVADAARRASAGDGRLELVPFGLCAHQDLYVLVRPPVAALPPFEPPLFPRGDLEASEIGADGLVRLEGWAEAGAGEAPPEARLLFRDRVAQVSPGEGAVGIRRRWRFEFPTRAVAPDDLVRVEAEGPRGRSNILTMGTLRPYLPARDSG